MACAPDCPLPENISTHDLTDLCEVIDINTESVLRSTFTLIDPYDSVWFGQVPGVRKYDLTSEDLRRSLVRIPDEVVYPELSHVTTLITQDRKDLYIKRPKFLCLDDVEETKLLPRILAEEVHILEFLKLHPHPNIVRYHGCIARRGRIVGIGLEKYDAILQYRFRDDVRELDIAACLDGIRSGMEHLHALGLAHNDLNPMNVALDECDRPVIIDFGSCRRFGKTLLTGGTPGWIDEDYDTSAQEHDESALKKIEGWLLENKLGKVVNVFENEPRKPDEPQR